MVHAADDLGITASEAIFVSPERANYIGLKMVNITRLPSPYPEHCVDKWPAGMTGSVTGNASYSQQACLKICLQRTIERKCKCQSAMLPQIESNNTDLRICDTRKKSKNWNGIIEMSSKFSSTPLSDRHPEMRRGGDVPTRKQNWCLPVSATLPVSTLSFAYYPNSPGLRILVENRVVQYEKTVSLAKWPTREVSFCRTKMTFLFLHWTNNLNLHSNWPTSGSCLLRSRQV